MKLVSIGMLIILTGCASPSAAPQGPVLSGGKAGEASKVQSPTKVASGVDQSLIDGTSRATERLLLGSDRRVTYDPATKLVDVSFVGVRTERVNYGNMWGNWRDAQSVVLKEFLDMSIPVDRVRVTTNFPDESGKARFTHSTANVLKFAKASDDRGWLRSGIGEMQDRSSANWKPMPQ